MFEMFSNVFQVLCFRRFFQVFHLSFFYVTTVASGCFKSRSDVPYECAWKVTGCVGDVRSGAGPLLMHSLTNPTR
jgi:hypothetical protein